MARGARVLRVTQGSDEANDGMNRYPVDNDGTVEVPAEVADRLIQGGGFVDISDPEPPAPGGYERLRHPDGSSCSWGGRSYLPGEAGVVTVPSGAVDDLASHGFTPVGEPPAPAADQPMAEEPETPAEEPAPEPEAEPAEEPETPAED